MANDIITFKEYVKNVTESLNKAADEYQAKTGCSDNEKNRLAHSIAESFGQQLFKGPTK